MDEGFQAFFERLDLTEARSAHEFRNRHTLNALDELVALTKSRPGW